MGVGFVQFYPRAVRVQKCINVRHSIKIQIRTKMKIWSGICFLENITIRIKIVFVNLSSINSVP
jgi:hypothetical protein